jgi:hypothetical protein
VISLPNPEFRHDMQVIGQFNLGCILVRWKKVISGSSTSISVTFGRKSYDFQVSTLQAGYLLLWMIWTGIHHWHLKSRQGILTSKKPY